VLLEKQKNNSKINVKEINSPKELSKLPVIQSGNSEEICDFKGYDIDSLMKETSQLRKSITKRGTLEILIPLCCNSSPVRYLTFRNSIKGFSSKTLAIRLKELEKSGV
jgi:hypothetical protein